MLKTVVTSEVVRHQGSGVEGDGLPVSRTSRQGGSEIIKKFHEKYGRAPTQPEVVRNWQQAVRSQAGMP